METAVNRRFTTPRDETDPYFSPESTRSVRSDVRLTRQISGDQMSNNAYSMTAAAVRFYCHGTPLPGYLSFRDFVAMSESDYVEWCRRVERRTV